MRLGIRAMGSQIGSNGVNLCAQSVVNIINLFVERPKKERVMLDLFVQFIKPVVHFPAQRIMAFQN
jgi:hypothetical protein